MTVDFFLSAGYPLISHFMARKPSNLGGFNLGGINATGQVGLATFLLSFNVNIALMMSSRFLA